MSGWICDKSGAFLPKGTPPPARNDHVQSDWYPWEDKADFLLSDFLFRKAQMSNGHIDELFEILSKFSPTSSLDRYKGHKDVHAKIDAVKVGDTPWKHFSCNFNGKVNDNSPSWMKQSFFVHYRDPLEIAKQILDNPIFADRLDYAPYAEFDKSGNRLFSDLMSANWAWEKAVSSIFWFKVTVFKAYTVSLQNVLSADPETHGSMLVPIILGSDKTTVSVATGNNEYYPLYMSLGNLHGSARRAHDGGVALLGFLAIPKSMLSAHC